MKKMLLLSAIAIPAVILLMSNTSGSNGGYSGNPQVNGGTNCGTACHNVEPTERNGLITTTIPETGYVPGETYTITASISEAGINKFGFELSELKGTLAPLDGTTKLVAGNKSVTHTGSSTSFDADAAWEFEWIAPEDESVDFYAAFNASNANGQTTGDKIFISQLSVNKEAGDTMSSVNAFSIESLSVSPNPARNLIRVNGLQNEAVQIFNLAGQLVITETNDTEIDITALAAGTYVVKTKNQSTKFIKH